MYQISFLILLLFRGLNELKNYQGPAASLINAIFGGMPFSSAVLSLPPALKDHQGNLVWFNANLDDSQKQAVEFALRQREVAIVHGPPGTGWKLFLVMRMICFIVVVVVV